MVTNAANCKEWNAFLIEDGDLTVLQVNCPPRTAQNWVWLAGAHAASCLPIHQHAFAAS